MGDPNSSAHTPGIPEASKGFQFLAAKYYGHISGVSMSRNGFSGVISASHTPVVLNTEQFYPLGGIRQCLETILTVMTGEEMLWASSR